MPHLVGFEIAACGALLHAICVAIGCFPGVSEKFFVPLNWEVDKLSDKSTKSPHLAKGGC